MNSLEKFNRHIGKNITIKVGDDDFEFKPLTYEQFGKVMVMGSKFKEGVDVNDLDKETVDTMMDLFYDIVRGSSDKNVPDVTCRQFVVGNIGSFGDILEKLTPKIDKKEASLIKERIQQVKDAKAESETKS